MHRQHICDSCRLFVSFLQREEDTGRHLQLSTLLSVQEGLEGVRGHQHSPHEAGDACASVRHTIALSSFPTTVQVHSSRIVKTRGHGINGNSSEYICDQLAARLRHSYCTKAKKQGVENRIQ